MKTYTIEQWDKTSPQVTSGYISEHTFKSALLELFDGEPSAEYFQALSYLSDVQLSHIKQVYNNGDKFAIQVDKDLIMTITYMRSDIMEYTITYRGIDKKEELDL